MAYGDLENRASDAGAYDAGFKKAEGNGLTVSPLEASFEVKIQALAGRHFVVQGSKVLRSPRRS